MENRNEKELQELTKASDVDQESQTLENGTDDAHSSRDSYSHHYHHHHHSEHHHSKHHHKSKKRRPKTKFGKLLSKNKSALVNVAVIVLAFLLVFAIAYVGEMRYNALEDTFNEEQQGGLFTDSSIQVEVSLFDKEVSLVGEAVTAYMKVDSSVPVGEVANKFEGRLDVGTSVVISYQVLGLPQGCSVQSVTLVVSEGVDDPAPRTMKLSGSATSASVKHLKTGTQYDYRLTFRLSNSVEASFFGTFRTADTPRVLSVDGLVNVRDIGGWETVDGKKIRQGLLYRGSEMDGAVHSEYQITAEGVSDMLTVLGIRSDLDLRTKESTPKGQDSLGANVMHKYYACSMYQGIFTDDGKKAVKEVFSDLAKPETYPAYLHCTYGADRTGTICYLLEALLGVSEEDLVREYELSGLVHPSLTRDNLMQIVSGLDPYEGTTIRQKVENYLLSIGVTDEEISAIRSIFLEA